VSGAESRGAEILEFGDDEGRAESIGNEDDLSSGGGTILKTPVGEGVAG
jgi:hypothetical protein